MPVDSCAWPPRLWLLLLLLLLSLLLLLLLLHDSAP
jgi:hypothetical protein